MKDIYSKENIKLVLLNTKRRFKNLYNRDYSIDDLVRAFNSLSSKHQDLLLKINKNENDKAMLRVTYDNLYKFLIYSLPEIKKEERARINIKSLKTINNMKSADCKNCRSADFFISELFFSKPCAGFHIYTSVRKKSHTFLK